MNKFGKLSLISASLVLPISLLVSSVVAVSLKSANPDNVDITAGLAYLRQILGSALISFLVVWVISFVSALVGLKKDTTKDFAKLGLIVLVAVTVLSLGAGIANKAAGDAEDAYRDNQAKEFFQKLQQDN